MTTYARIAAIAALLACSIVPTFGSAAEPTPLGPLRPAPSNDWDDLQVGDILATGVVETNAGGETGCQIPGRISLKARLPAGAPAGYGKSMTVSTARSADNPSVCHAVVTSKTLLIEGAPASDKGNLREAPASLTVGDPAVPGHGVAVDEVGNPPEMSAVAASSGGSGGGSGGGSCGPTSTSGVHSDLTEGLKGTAFKVTARLMYNHSPCSVSVAGVRGFCTFDPQRGVLRNCSAGVTTNDNPVSYEVWGTYAEDASGNVASLHTKANGYVGGQGDCDWSWSNTWGNWPITTNCYPIYSL